MLAQMGWKAAFFLNGKARCSLFQKEYKFHYLERGNSFFSMYH